MRTSLISRRNLFAVLLCAAVLGMMGTAFAEEILPDANLATVDKPAYISPPEYAPNEIIVKFHRNIADIIETELAKSASGNELQLSDSLDKLNNKYGLRKAEPLFKNFKENRQRVKALLSKDETQLSKKERHILRRLKRAPKVARVPDLSRIYKLKLELEAGQSLEEVVAEYNNDPDVEYAELDHIVSINLTPNDPFYSQQWALPKIDAPAAWDINTGSSDIIVAVIDTGVDYTHIDIDDNMWVNSGEIPGNGVDDDGNGYIDDIYGYDFGTYGGETRDSNPMDDQGHGTLCSGIIAAEGNNGLDIAGVCWNGSIMALKFIAASGYGWESDAADAIYYAVENGADVLSNSYGGDEYFQPLKDAIDYAHSQGVIMVASAGNDNTTSPQYPAYYNHMISVAATTSNDQKASFSNYGNWVDIAAPGVDILSLRKGGGTITKSGTSMACPYVAGVCALLLSIHPEILVDELKQVLFESTDPIASGVCASGRLNAYQAVQQTISSQGRLLLDSNSYLCSGLIGIGLHDSGLKGNGMQPVTIETDGGDFETVVLSETTSAIGFFTGTISISSSSPNIEDGILQISHGETITATYADSNDGTGNPATVIDTAMADCQGPMVLDLELVDVLSRRVKVRFDTDEPTTAIIRGGLTCGEPYSITGEDQELSTSHTIELIGLESETEYYFVIEANDALGNATTEDNGGACYSFTTTPIPPPIVDVVNIFSTRAEVRFETDEPTTAVLRGGLGCGGPYTITKNSSTLAIKHTFYLDGLASDTNYYFVIEAVDDFGHEMVADNNGLCYSFTTNSAPPPLHVPSEYPTIQAAVDAASTDDTIVVADGTYTGNGNRDIDFKGKVITLRSENGPGNCIIDCQASQSDTHRGFYFQSGEDRYTVLDGFTVTNGYDWVARERFYKLAGGILCEESSPTITNCVISGNTAKKDGTLYCYSAGGILCYKSSPVIADCTISNNSGRAGGISYERSNSPTITNCVISNNDGLHVGGIKSFGSNITISNCIITGNTGVDAVGGIGTSSEEGRIANVCNCIISDNRGGFGAGIWASPAIITNCTIIDNVATVWGGGIYVTSGRVTTITNCIFWGNEALWWGPLVAQIYVWTGPWPATAYVTYCDVQDGYNEYMGVTLWENNIETDPLFADSGNGDYRLQWASPCIDAGTNSPVGELCITDIEGKPRLLDGDGDGNSIVDIGAYEFSPGPIQTAINNAFNGDIIVIEPGVYNENITFRGKDLTVSSTDPNDPAVVAATVIDGGGKGSVVTFSGSEDANCMLSGFTITGGVTSERGGGVCGNGTLAGISKCVIKSNSAGRGGGLADINGTISNCIITGNYATIPGGGIVSCHGTVTNCLIYDNSAARGGGLNNCDGDITNCTIFSNMATIEGGGLRRCDGTITNCIIWDNSPGQLLGGAEPTYSCIQNWTGGGTGNISKDPRFVTGSLGDFYLGQVVAGQLVDSPCVDAGSDLASVFGFDELTTRVDHMGDTGMVDMGYHYVPPNTEPVACIAGGDQIAEADSNCEARVVLDGSCSSDEDSTPGTNDDINDFDWYEIIDPCDPNTDIYLGSGEIIECNLPLGEHIILLEVTDTAGASDSNGITVTVEDVTPPEFTLSVEPNVLWPVNHKMVGIVPTFTVSDNCDESPEVTLVSITANEGNDGTGGGHTDNDIQINEGNIYLRAERRGKGTGRIYTITYQAVDDSGNVSIDTAEVVVPHDRR